MQKPPTPDKAEHSPAVEASVPRRNYKISTLIDESSGTDLEMLMIKMREQTGEKPKQAEALEAAIQDVELCYDYRILEIVLHLVLSILDVSYITILNQIVIDIFQVHPRHHSTQQLAC